MAINTPPFLHGRMLRQAAEAGKHIFAEKPLATTMEEAELAVQAASKAGVQLADLCNHLVGASPDAVSGYAQQRQDGRVDRVSATIRPQHQPGIAVVIRL